MALLYGHHPHFWSVERLSILLLLNAPGTCELFLFRLENPAKILPAIVRRSPFSERWFPVLLTVLQTQARSAVLNCSNIHTNLFLKSVVARNVDLTV